MAIDGNLSVKDFVAQLEAEHEERGKLIALLKKELSASTNGKGAQPTTKAKQIAGQSGMIPPLATLAIGVIRDMGVDMSNGEIRLELLRRKLATDSRTLTAQIHTALGRRPKEVRRTEEDKWALIG